ncbi:hypothetical protein E2562_024140 [Oryza meyeriana var. granulata]|uniref:DUF1618 domain-containing protein n=1 Tax=Oryza meyeriana var. granulata TaxID=110450 RepID=A0A6G1EP50_9ORYZ|nr:hypothetical protein E2562_024140 [Oryza meyeriana var. granulata]
MTKRVSLPDKWLEDQSWFLADLTFPFEGHGFWADLTGGVLFCSYGDLLSDKVHHVDMGFINLPPGCQRPGLRHSREAVWPAVSRTMGYSGVSIKFVSIDGFLEQVTPADRKVTVWKLLDRKTWVIQHEVSLESQLKQELSKAKLPEHMTVMYPILSTREEHVIYIILSMKGMQSGGGVGLLGEHFEREDFVSQVTCWRVKH